MVRKAWETKGTTAVARRGTAPRPVHVPRTGFLSGRKPAPAAHPVHPAHPVPAVLPGAVSAGGYGHLVPMPVLHQRPGAAPAPAPGPGVLAPPGGMVLNGVVLDAGQVAAMEPVLSRASRAVRRAAWRRRWELTPAYAGAGVLVAGTAAPVTATGVLAAVAVAAYAAAEWAPRTVAGRAWLSARERVLAAAWCAGGAVWAGAQATGWVHPGRGTAAALIAATGPQAILWARSRRVRPTGDDAEPDAGMSAEAAALVTAWPVHVAPTGPAPLIGSHIDPATMREPAQGAYSFAVELDESVHAECVTGDSARQHIERRLRLPVGCVELGVDPDDSGRVLVTMTPGRWLENAPAPWPGPVLNEDGSIDFATARNGQVVPAMLHNASGVEHGGIFGCTGVGKSNSLVTMVLPGVMAAREVLWYIDGGQGTSAAHLAGACDVWAVRDVEQWRQVIHAAHAVMRARKDRRAKLGLSKWRGAAESDPILTLVLDEATTIAGALTRVKDKITAELALEILREGRKLGVRIIQLAQDPMGTGLVGGRQARALMAGGGTLVGHRPGDSTSNTLTTGSTSEGIDLRALPPEAGWVAVINKGKVLSKCARVAYADEDQVLALLTGFTPRALTGADAAAAGPAYTHRVHGPAAAATIAAAQTADDGDVQDDVQDDAPHTDLHLTAVPLEEVDAPHDVAGRLAASAARLARPMHALTAASTCQDDDQPDDVDQGEESQDGALTVGPPAFIPAQLSGSQATAQAQAAENRAAVLDVLVQAGGAPVGTARLMRETGLAKATVQRAITTLRDAEQVSAADGGGWVAVEIAA